MDAAHTHDVKNEVRGYWIIFSALAFLTVVTVLVSRLHLGLAGNITVALVIATFKASLVASFFMHLISERQLIYALLTMTGIFLVCLVILLLGTQHDPITGSVNLVTQTVSHPVH